MKLNKILALLLCFALVMASFPAFAETDEIKWICKRSIRINDSTGNLWYPEVPEGYEDYFTDWGGLNDEVPDWWGHSLHIGQTNCWLGYSVPVPDTGVYELFVVAGTYENYPATITTEVNGVTAASAVVDTCDWEPNVKVSLGYLPLNEGYNDIKLTVEQGGGGAIAIKSYSLKKVAAPSISGFKAEGKSFIDGDTVKRGTDSISIECTNPFNEESTKDAQFVILGEDSQTINVNAKSDSNTVVLSFLKTLSYGKGYTLTVSGLKDAYGYVLDDFSVNFTASGEEGDEGVSEAVITDAPDLQNSTVITVKGIIKNSLGDGIEGRKATLEIKAPDKSVITTLDTVSGEGGTVEFSYQLPDDADAGLYSISLDCEYAQEAATDTVRYISENLKIQILGEIEKAADWEAVENIFSSYSQELGIDLSELDAETDEESGEVKKYGISDKSKFYARFAKQKFDKIEDFADAYNLNFAVEVFLQNTSAEDRKAILNDSETAGNLDFDFGIIENLTEENKEKFWTDSSSVTREKADTKEEIIEELEKIANKYFLEQNGKENMTVFADDVAAYIGQQAAFEIECAETADLCGYEITVAPSNGKVENIGFETVNSGETKEIILKDSSATIKVENLKKSAYESLGTLTFDTEATGEISFVLSGKVKYKTAEFEYVMYADIEPCTFKLTVKENTSHAGPSYSSGSFGGGGGSSSKKENQTVVEPEKPQTQPDEKEYKFSDLSNVSWAENSIYELLEKGVISKSDNNKFRPHDNVTRAEFIKMLVITLGVYDENATSDFSDVTKTDWYAKYVASAQKNGLILGSGNNMFNPQGAITRQDICVILNRVMDKMGYKEEIYEAVFKDDADIAEYAKNAVYRLYDFKIIKGMGDGIFAPQNSATRAMTAKMLVEFLKGVEA